MTTADLFNLERFVTAQSSVFDTVLAELRAGRKRTHWMWFVFPQLSGLGRSSTAQFYGITSLDEARAYLAHPVLGHGSISAPGSCSEAWLHPFMLYSPTRAVIRPRQILPVDQCHDRAVLLADLGRPAIDRRARHRQQPALL
jgi:hypothetical protein